MAHDPRVDRLIEKARESRRQMELVIEILEKFSDTTNMDMQIREEVEDLIFRMKYGD